MATPVHSHPLSPEEHTPARNARGRPLTLEAERPRPVTSYFALKQAADERAQGSELPVASTSSSASPLVKDASPRPPPTRVIQVSKGASPSPARRPAPSPSHRRASTSSVARTNASTSKPPPLPQFVAVLQPQISTPPETPRSHPALRISENESAFLRQDAAAQVLDTRWHAITDEDIQSTISDISIIGSPSEHPKHPYHSALRVLSEALASLRKEQAEWEQGRRTRTARRRQAHDLLAGMSEVEAAAVRKILSVLDGEDSTEDDSKSHLDSIDVRDHPALQVS